MGESVTKTEAVECSGVVIVGGGGLQLSPNPWAVPKVRGV